MSTQVLHFHCKASIACLKPHEPSDEVLMEMPTEK